MKNKILLFFFCASLLISLAGLIILIATYFENGSFLLNIGLIISNLLGLIILIKNSTIRKTFFYNIILICFSVTIIGVLFKIQHWQGGSLLLIISSASIIITYSVRFFKKENKSQLDIMKWAWIVSAFTTSLFLIMHWISSELSFLPNLILITTVIHFGLLAIKNKELLEI